MKKNLFYYAFLALLLLFVIYFAKISIKYLDVNFTEYNAFLVAFTGILLAVCLWIFMPFIKINIKEYIVFSLIIFTALVLRVLWIIYVHPKPVSDFELYYKLGDLLSKGLTGYEEYVAIFPHVFGLSFVLSLIFRVFGTGLTAVFIFNVILSTLTVAAVYFSVKLVSSKKAASAAALLLAVWPSSICMNSLVATEPLHMFLLSAAVFFIFFAEKKYQNSFKKLVFYGITAVILSFANQVRPVSPVFLIAAAITLLLFNFQSLKLFWKNILSIALMFVIFAGTGELCALGADYFMGVRVARNSSGFTLARGANFESGGAYSPKDAEIIFELAKTMSPDMAHAEMTKIAVERIRADVPGYFALLGQKIKRCWQDDNYAVVWNYDLYDAQSDATEEMRQGARKFNYTAMLYWCFIMTLTAISLIKMAISKRFNYSILLVLFILGFMDLLAISEMQTRYKFAAMLPFCIIAGQAFCYDKSINILSFLKGRGRADAGS